MPDFVKNLRSLAQKHPMLTAQQWVNNPIGSIRNRFAYGSGMGYNDPNLMIQGSGSNMQGGQGQFWVRIVSTLDEIKTGINNLNNKFDDLLDSQGKTQKAITDKAVSPLKPNTDNNPFKKKEESGNGVGGILSSLLALIPAAGKLGLGIVGLTASIEFLKGMIDRITGTGGSNAPVYDPKKTLKENQERLHKAKVAERKKGGLLAGAATGFVGGAMLGGLTGPLAPIASPILAIGGGVVGGIEGYRHGDNPATRLADRVLTGEREYGGKDPIWGRAAAPDPSGRETFTPYVPPVAPPTGHAAGGPLVAGHDYEVGEKGPEKVHVDKTGKATVLSNMANSESDNLPSSINKLIDAMRMGNERLLLFIDKIIGKDNRQTLYAFESGFQTGRRLGLYAGVGLDAVTEGAATPLIPEMMNAGGMIGGLVNMRINRPHAKSNVGLKNYDYHAPKSVDELIERNEGFVSKPTADPGAYGVGKAIGYGHELTSGNVVNIGGKEVDVSGGISKEQATDLLHQDIAKASNMAIKAAGGLDAWNKLTKGDQAKLIDYAYNHGHGATLDPSRSVDANLDEKARNQTRVTARRIEKTRYEVDSMPDATELANAPDTGTKINNRAMASAGAPIIIKGGDTINNVSGGGGRGKATDGPINVSISPSAPYNAVDMLHHLS